MNGRRQRQQVEEFCELLWRVGVSGGEDHGALGLGEEPRFRASLYAAPGS